ncbi:MAG TPA: DUF4835 family protein [Bacteroidota bacterium]|nr:DUF4835 family protein [Bacteroidota bacterium]
MTYSFFARLSTLALTLAVGASFSPLSAQGINCTVTVNTQSVNSTNKDLLVNLASDLKDYINNFQWGADNVPDKIPCAIDVFVQGNTGDNSYLAQVFIGSQRPIYKSNKGTAVMRIKDDSWEFTYLKSRPINHNPGTFNDLTSFLDFYMYLVVGFDADTYDPLGGTPYFQRASDISRLARTSSQKGWQPSTTGYNRSQFIDDVLLPSTQPMRQAEYLYYFTGLDSLAIDRSRAQANIARAIDIIGKVRANVDPRNLALRVFFDAKYQELGDIFADYPDRTIYRKLSLIDPNHEKTYDDYLRGK